MTGLRLDQALQQLLPDYSRSRLQTWIKEKRVTLDGQCVAPKQAVWGGGKVRVEPELHPSETPYAAEEIALDIMYEDDALLVVNKPAGLVVHPGSGNWQGTMLNALLHHAPQLACIPRAGIVHRLDKDTSGLLVVAKTLTAQTDLVRQLQARSVKRDYLAVVQGLVAHDGKVEAPLGRHPSQRIKMAIVHNGKPAVTHYAVLEHFDHHTLIRCSLETGRTHQIRVHMQSIGHPLAGDPVYGGRPLNLPPLLRDAVKNLGRQALHAERLGLIHPVSGEAMEWRADLPQDMADLLKVLRHE
ncbi:23S rRNA pseudouridine(1911/1915/1917) synthase RluD [Sulfuricella sp.]|uniref:23S rRNA pseudouridine(1911/1915/1917) synthase RluD n=1 Tax=Sulfuricella sp. TaxID=2099377 RepID=UPI002CFF44F6|nr:23S rRNA pseudouridine(1911/1915/1917) synthase RluD [Sulfuricella sp.]HUX64461.1 23S rRNA pseudouridine(1911/1915/1917) synthase RluD [Sulfuricella sp.]